MDIKVGLSYIFGRGQRSCTSLLVYLACMFLSGCEPKWDFGSVDFEPQIVVEGWIEDGDFPIVCLTQTKTLDMPLDSSSAFDVAIRWAKVTVDDGTNSEILTGRIDRRYVPPYVYTGSRMRGEAGKSYNLKVEYSGRTVTATTYIPEPVSLDKIVVEKCDDDDTLFQIKAHFHDDKSEKNYYKFFTRVWSEDKRFFSSFLGTFDDSILPENGDASVSVFRGIRFTTLDKYTPFYRGKDSVVVKFTQLPEEGFRFWSSYESEVTNGKNPIFPSSSNLVSNVHGGLGVWCGYGASIYYVTIKDSLDSGHKERIMVEKRIPAP